MVKDGILGKSWLRASALLDDKKEYDEEKKKKKVGIDRNRGW